MMTSKTFPAFLALAGLALAACSDQDRTTAGYEADEPRVAAREEMPAEPDDTGRNVRDRDDRTVTPGDPSNSESDLELARRIREGITSNDSLSIDAKNVKVVTQNGVVTLRGPVGSEQERMTIESIAQQTDGVMRVDNQLEVDTDSEPTYDEE